MNSATRSGMVIVFAIETTTRIAALRKPERKKRFSIKDWKFAKPTHSVRTPGLHSVKA